MSIVLGKIHKIEVMDGWFVTWNIPLGRVNRMFSPLISIRGSAFPVFLSKPS